MWAELGSAQDYARGHYPHGICAFHDFLYGRAMEVGLPVGLLLYLRCRLFCEPRGINVAIIMIKSCFSGKHVLTSSCMKPLYLLLASAVLLSSCSVVKNVFSAGEYTPEYLKEDSPLDPPGTAAAREEARRKLVKEGLFMTGAEIDVRDGKAYLFNRNPDYSDSPGGRMVKSEKAKILSCEGTYYFVEVDGGKRGFLRESDFVDPVTMLTTTSDFLPAEQGILPGATGNVLPDAELQIGDNQTLTTNKVGRTVVVVGTKDDKADDFEAAKREVESGKSLPAAAPVVDEEYEPLPEPSASSN